MTTILLATRNVHKVAEIQAILGESFRFFSLNNYPKAPKVIEDADTFAGNATKKSVELARWLASDNSKLRIENSKLDFVLADDSGLEVDALGGKPGVHSARFAALEENENSTDAENSAKLLRLLKNVPLKKRSARFRCVIALVSIAEKQIEGASPVCYADELELQTQLFDGVCDGKIIFEPRGKNGFGYDPLFVPNGSEQTFAELGDNVKNKLSHRAKALEKLKIHFNKLPS